MSNSKLFTPEQTKEANDLAKKANDFLASEKARNYYSLKISNGIGSHAKGFSKAFVDGVSSVRQDSSRFLD
jgi:hypothetical protein